MPNNPQPFSTQIFKTSRAWQALAHRPLVWLLPFYLLGITWAGFTPELSSTPLLITAASLSLIAIFFLLKPLSFMQKYAILLLAPALVTLGAGLCILAFTPPDQPGHLLQNLNPKPVILGGLVHKDSGWRPGQNYRLILDAREIIFPGDHGPGASRQVFGLARLSVGGRLDVETGDYLRLPVTLEPLAGMRNPGVYDFQKYWAAKGVWVGGYVKSPHMVTSWPEAGQNWFLSRWRDAATAFIEQQISQPAAGLMASMLVGRRGAVDQDTNEIFRSLGLSHILAVSGLHLGLWYGLCFFLIRLLLRYCGTPKGLKLNLVTALLALIPALGYALLVGPASPVVRAALMITAATLALLTWRRTDPWNILLTAAWIILLIEPQRLFTASFQLSFVATGAMLAVFSPRPSQNFSSTDNSDSSDSSDSQGSPNRLYQLFRWLCRTPVDLNLFCQLAGKISPGASHYFSIFTQTTPTTPTDKPARVNRSNRSFFQSALLATLAGGLGTAPLVVWHFGRLPLAGLIVNIIFTPMISFFVLLPGLLALAVLPLSSTVAAVIMTLAGTVLNGLLPVMELVAQLTGPGWLLPVPGILVFIGWYGAGWVWLRGSGSRKQRLILAGLLLTVAFLPGLLQSQGHTGVLRFTVLDVGQGSSVHLNFPDGSQMLVDGGGSLNFDPGEMIITPYLLGQGLKRLDVVALTHPDRDHLKGLLTINKYFNPREVWSGSWPPDTSILYQDFLKTIAPGTRTNLNPLYQGRYFGPARVTLLWPRFDQGLWLDEALKADWQNHYGLVLQIQWQEISFLITGDIGPKVEAALVQRYGLDLKSTVLIAPHHGSRTGLTPQFLEAVTPDWVVFNCGRRNYYGLPHPEALARAKEAGAKIWRTDLNGAAIFEVREGANGLVLIDPPAWPSTPAGDFSL